MNEKKRSNKTTNLAGRLIRSFVRCFASRQYVTKYILTYASGIVFQVCKSQRPFDFLGGNGDKISNKTTNDWRSLTKLAMH